MPLMNAHCATPEKHAEPVAVQRRGLSSLLWPWAPGRGHSCGWRIQTSLGLGIHVPVYVYFMHVSVCVLTA